MDDDINLDGKIIAVVDDSEIVLKGMRGFLEVYGATVLTYNNGHNFCGTRHLLTAS